MTFFDGFFDGVVIGLAAGVVVAELLIPRIVDALHRYHLRGR